MTDPIVVERLLDTNTEETFALLTEPERLRRWLAVSASVDLRVGGEYRMLCVPGHAAVGQVTEIEPGKRVVYSWGWHGDDEVPPGSSSLIVELEPDGERTRVRLTHEGLVGVWAERHLDGWNQHLDRLVAAAAKGDAGLEPWIIDPDDKNHLTVAEATWAICRQQLLALGPDDSDRPTPCAEFNAHELVVHLRNSMVALGTPAGAVFDDGAGTTTAEDYVAGAVEAALAAWRDHGLDGEVPFGDGTAPALLPAGILSLEFLVHAWDIAQAKGSELDVPEAIAAYVLDIATSIISDDNRGPGKGFGVALDAHSDDPMGRLIAFTGRKALA
ncbi:MAG: TIGR03086 family metal-binding protein [Acidimicrobiia bacterium]|nr:TIGR03086 family metal-binding protein [Acidimicrobiia bacterium]